MRLENPSLLVLSRRNLLTLLAKLDGYPENSACQIFCRYDKFEEDADGQSRPTLGRFDVKAEPDEVHYAHESREGEPPGRMHPATESVIG